MSRYTSEFGPNVEQILVQASRVVSGRAEERRAAADGEIAELIAQLSVVASDRLDDWQPIETAPQDGTHILLYSPPREYEGKPVEDRVTYGYWLIEEHGEYLGDCGGECRCPEYGEPRDPFWMSEDGGFLPDLPPTHWRRLPAPPSA